MYLSTRQVPVPVPGTTRLMCCNHNHAMVVRCRIVIADHLCRFRSQRLQHWTRVPRTCIPTSLFFWKFSLRFPYRLANLSGCFLRWNAPWPPFVARCQKIDSSLWFFFRRIVKMCPLLKSWLTSLRLFVPVVWTWYSSNIVLVHECTVQTWLRPQEHQSFC